MVSSREVLLHCLLAIAPVTRDGAGEAEETAQVRPLQQRTRGTTECTNAVVFTNQDRCIEDLEAMTS